MIFTYFIRRFLQRFILITGSLIGVFGIIHLFVRVSEGHLLGMIPIVFGVMLPMMLPFVAPVAAMMSVCTVLTEAGQKQELYTLYFIQRARRALIAAIFVFSSIISLLFAVLVFVGVPHSYLKGKKAIMKLAQQKIFFLNPDTVHELVPGAHLVFAHKELLDDNHLYLKNLFLRYKDAHQAHYFFTASEGELSPSHFFLKGGSLLYQFGEHSYYATFEDTSFNIASLIKVTDFTKQQMKYHSWKTLRLHQDNPEYRIEFHKRCATILWQLLFPLLIFLAIFFKRHVSNMWLFSLFISGLFFLGMHVALLVSLMIKGTGVLFLFYGVPLGVMVVFINYYFKNS